MFAALYGNTHTNTIDGFWATVKRAIFGQFHHVSRKYLPLYLDEIAYRYNRRSVGEKASLAFSQVGYWV